MKFLNNVKLLLHPFDANYNHPLALPGDPCRKVSNSLREEYFFYNLLFFVGFLFFWCGLAMTINLLVKTDFQSLFFGNNFKHTKGKIVKVIKAHYSEHDSSFFEYLYSYQIGQKQYTGQSYDRQRPWYVDSLVTVHYQPASPGSSRIAGMRMNPVHPGTLLFVFLLPLVGFAIMLYVVHNGMRKIMYLRHGIVTEALVTESFIVTSYNDEKEDTRDIHVEFISNKGKSIRTKINVSLAWKAKPGRNVTVLYLPWDHQQAVFVRMLSPEERQVLGF